MKTARFSHVVAQSGSPEPYTLWLEPKDDRTFQQALKANRIMTVRQETTGSKADFGEVGYTGARGELLLFPSSLASFVGKRIVGVKYDLLAVPVAIKSVPPTRSKATPRAKTTSPANVVLFDQSHEEEDKEEDIQESKPALKLRASETLRSVPKDPPPSPSPSASAIKQKKVTPRPLPSKSLPPKTRANPAPRRSPQPARPKEAPTSGAASPRQTRPLVTPPEKSSRAPQSASLPLLRQAMRELKNGKVVKAYESLQELDRLLR